MGEISKRPQRTARKDERRREQEQDRYIEEQFAKNKWVFIVGDVVAALPFIAAVILHFVFREQLSQWIVGILFLLGGFIWYVSGVIAGTVLCYFLRFKARNNK